MCDETDLDAFAGNGLSRREFAAAGALAGLAACTSIDGGAGTGLTETMVSIPTADGTMDAFFVHPVKKAPAVILWPDIAGLREVKKAMARRLAGEGYAVLVANPYYRDMPAPQFADFADFMKSDGFQKVTPWRAKATPEAIIRDGKALVAWLDGQRAVDTRRGIGNQGYCMGGPYTVYTAAAAPARVKAAASFHGGGLVTDQPTSPHLQLQSNTSYLFAIGQNDDAKQPQAKEALRKAADAAGAKAWLSPRTTTSAPSRLRPSWRRLASFMA
jgi:carboxymethylenebutenolidase